MHSRSGAVRVWRIRVEGATAFTSWGQAGGKFQDADETFNGVNLGKKNEVRSEEYALDRAREMCRKKNWEGYREVYLKDGLYHPFDPYVDAAIDFDNLPLSLSFYKPDNTMGSRLTKMAEAGQVWYTRKRNGMMKVLVKNNAGELQIYSRRMLRQHDDEQGTEYTWDDRFPHLIHAIEPHLPPRTILLGELVVEDTGEDGRPRERFDLAQSYIKSLTPKAVADMEKSGLWPFFYCWDIAFWNGEDLVKTWPVQGRFRLIEDLDAHIASRFFQPITYLNNGHLESPAVAEAAAKDWGYEGWVVVDPEAIYGDKAYNFKGKPDRPGTACAKLKPTYEDDFIALWNPDRGHGERSTKGSRGGGIKSVGLFQYNTKGDLVFIANVSSGITKEMFATLADPAKFPQVWKVSYKGRRYMSDGDDTNALDHPSYEATRDDKTPHECMNERL